MDKEKMNKGLIIILFGIWAVASQCGKAGRTADGSISESPNAFIKGSVLYKQGSLSSAGTEITRYTIQDSPGEGYKWHPVDTVQADSTGEFLFDSVAAGNYSLVFVKEGYEAFSNYFGLGADDTEILLDTAFLDQPKKVVSNILCYASTSPDDTILVRLIGTPYKAQAFEFHETFVFDSLYLPWGDYKMEIRFKPVAGTVQAQHYYVNFPIVETAGIRDTSLADYSDLPGGKTQVDTVIIYNEVILVSSPGILLRYKIGAP